MTTLTAQVPSVVSFDEVISLYSGKLWDKVYTNVPNSKIGRTLTTQLSYILNQVGEKFDPDGSILTVKAENGVFKALYSPTLYKVSNTLLRGSAYAKANPSLFEDEPAENGETGYNLGVRFSQTLFVPYMAFTNIEGTDAMLTDSGITIVLPESEEFPEGLTFDLGARFAEADMDKRKSDSLKMRKAFSKGTFFTYLAEPPTGGGSATPLRDLEDGTEYKIVGYEFKESDNGGFFILTTENGMKIMSNKAIARTLEAGPVVTPAKPCLLRVVNKSKMPNGNIKVNASLVIPSENFPSRGDIDLDW
jgi:hypothetical protein